MKRYCAVVLLLRVLLPIAAQHNWAAIPCSKVRDSDAINKMMVDSLHNEVILFSINGNKICNTNYKGLFAFDGAQFRDLDKGVDTHDYNSSAGSAFVGDCITYENKTLFGGSFLSVGANVLYAKSIALWNHSNWDSFPTHVFSNTPNWNAGGTFASFLKWKGKLWMGGGFDAVGNTTSKNLVAYDGNTFMPVPTIPVTYNAPITKMIVYKNKLIVTGNFNNYPSTNLWRLAQYDGSSWSPVGSGVMGGIGGVWDMTVYKDTLYIAGSYNKSSGNLGNYLMKWDGNQLYDAGFGDYCGFGPILSLIPFKNRLYTFGYFPCAANQKAFGVAYYENGRWVVPQDSMDNIITSAVLYNGSIYIGGAFKSINGDTTIQKFAKLICPDFDAAIGCVSGLRENSNKLDVKVYPNPAQDKLYIEFENYDIDKITLSNNLGQVLIQLQKPKSKQEIDISLLSPGIYFLKAQNRQGYSVFKLERE